MKNIAIIPARSGSKGVKDKNIREINGKPLLAYSIAAAQESGLFDKIFVSTDSEKYADIAQKYGADASFLRSEKNSSDSAGTWDGVREVINIWETKGQYYDTITLLQPTSPLRTAEDIQECFRTMEEKDANAVISVCEMEHSPLWCNTLGEDLCMDEFEDSKYTNCPRQSLPKYYRLNGAVYLLKREELNQVDLFKNKCYGYIMSCDKSVDIDTEQDLAYLEFLIKREQQ